MKRTIPFGPIAVVITLVVATAWLQDAWSQDRKPAPREATVGNCHEIMSDFQLLYNDMVDLDRRLAAKIDAMQAADEAERLDAIAAAVEELATQRSEAFDKMKMVHQKLVVHLLDHMLLDPHEARETLAACPVMKVVKRDQRPTGTSSTPPGPLDR